MQIDQLGAEVLHREAYTMLQEMEPLYRLLQVWLGQCVNKHSDHDEDALST
jgi:hypothetical protein